MSLLTAVNRAKTEEDVKDAYIEALGLRQYFKGLVDIQTDKVWFEAKEVPTAPDGVRPRFPAAVKPDDVRPTYYSVRPELVEGCSPHW